MADIFISYKPDDKQRVARIVESLRGEGFDVWWDHDLAPGPDRAEVIQRELAAAKAVVAVWSRASAAAPWVREEAQSGLQRNALISVRIDATAPPADFDGGHTLDLSDWTGDARHPQWALAVKALRAMTRGGAAPILKMKAPRGLALPRMPAWALGAAVAAAAIVGLGAAFATGAVSLPRIALPQPQIAAQSAPAPAAAPIAADPSEAAWAALAETKSGETVRAFLDAHPESAHADEARAYLATCRTQTRETWSPRREERTFLRRTPQRVSAERDACATAKDRARERWEEWCGQFASAGGAENARGVTRTQTFEPCDCDETSAGFICTARADFVCTWEQRTAVEEEICG